MAEITRLNIQIHTVTEMMALFGTGDKNLKLLGELFHTEVYHIEGGIGIETTDAVVLERLNRVLSLLLELHHKNIVFNERDIVYIVNLVAIETDNAILDLFLTRKEIIKTFAGKPVFAKEVPRRD